jgi:hypothetical protein
MMNPYEARNRLRKASRILSALDDAAPGHRITSESLAHLTPEQWVQAAIIAGKSPPSVACKAIVAELVDLREAAERRAS